MKIKSVFYSCAIYVGLTIFRKTGQHFQERYDPESVFPNIIILKFVEIVDGATLKNEKTHNIFQRVGHFKWTISRTNFRFIGQVTAKKILF